MELIMSVEAHIRKSNCPMNQRALYNERFVARLTCVSSATERVTGRVSVTHGQLRYGGATIAIRNSIHNNKPSVMNGRAGRAVGRAVAGTAVIDAVARGTGRTSVTHVYRDDERINSK